MSKASVEEKKLKPFVVMPDAVESAFGGGNPFLLITLLMLGIHTETWVEQKNLQ